MKAAHGHCALAPDAEPWNLRWNSRVAADPGSVQARRGLRDVHGDLASGSQPLLRQPSTSTAHRSLHGGARRSGLGRMFHVEHRREFTDRRQGGTITAAAPDTRKMFHVERHCAWTLRGTRRPCRGREQPGNGRPGTIRFLQEACATVRLRDGVSWAGAMLLAARGHSLDTGRASRGTSVRHAGGVRSRRSRAAPEGS